MRLFDKELQQQEVHQRTGCFSQFAGVELITLGDGVERGIRCLDFNTGNGFEFRVMIDRALDIGPANFRGAALGWHSPTGFPHPSLHEHETSDGLGWLRSFSGLMMTCGMDHILAPGTHDVSHYGYPHRNSMEFPVHGRVAMCPAKLLGYGTEWQGDECILWCEGIVRQAQVFGENLELHRRIESWAGGKSFTIRDRVTNRGFSPTPHMYMYHINLGYPLLDEGSRFVAPVTECVWASHDIKAQDVGYHTQPGPRKNFAEQVYEHRAASDANGRVPVALVNPRFSKEQGIGLLIEYQAEQFPCLFQWQCYQEGLYSMGIEPSTNHVLGKQYAEKNGQLKWLEHGQSEPYEISFEVLADNSEIDEAEKRIQMSAAQLGDTFVTPTGNWHMEQSE